MDSEKSLRKRAWIMLIIPPFMLGVITLLFGVGTIMYKSGDTSSINSDLQALLPLILTVNHLTLLFILRSFLRKDNIAFGDIGWTLKDIKLPVEVVIGLVLALALYLFNQFVIEPIQAVYAGNSPDFSLNFTVRNQIPWALLASAATLPIIEELIYRGYACKGLTQKYGVVFTMIASSVLFAALHWGMGVLTMTLITSFGIIYFLVFLFRKRNLVAITVSHCVYNTLVLLFV